MNKDQKDDIYWSMRPIALLLFVIAWNAPVISWVIRYGFLSAGFDRMVVIQLYLLVAACLALATSASLQRLVFRPEVPIHYFRRSLFVGAGFFFAITSVALLTGILSFR